jgi:hypothetical protein
LSSIVVACVVGFVGSELHPGVRAIATPHNVVFLWWPLSCRIGLFDVRCVIFPHDESICASSRYGVPFFPLGNVLRTSTAA